MWHPYDLGTFGDTHEFSIYGADAALIACCDGDGPAAIATAWFSLDGSPFSVHGPASLVGTPDLASRFASSIVLELTRDLGHQILERIALEEGGPRGSSIEVPRGVPA
jgi:hypothetical protein